MKLISESLDSFINERKDLLKGGQGDKLSIKDVNQKQLKIGIKVEREHSNNIKIQTEIALDHLAENPKYYSELIEAGLVDELPAIKLYIKFFGVKNLPTKYKKIKK